MKRTYTLFQRIKLALKIIFFGVPDIKRAEFTWTSHLKIGKGKWTFVSATLIADVFGNWYVEKSSLFGDKKPIKPQFFAGPIGETSIKEGEELLYKYLF